MQLFLGNADPGRTDAYTFLIIEGGDGQGGIHDRFIVEFRLLDKEGFRTQSLFVNGAREDLPLFRKHIMDKDGPIDINHHGVDDARALLDILDPRVDKQFILSQNPFFSDVGELMNGNFRTLLHLLFNNLFLIRESDHAEGCDGDH